MESSFCGVIHIILSQAQQFTMFLVAMVTLTIGELLYGQQFRPLQIYLRQKDKLGFYQGVVNSAATVGKCSGRSLAEQLLIYIIWKYCL